MSVLEVPGAGRFDGLDPERADRVEPVLLAGGPRFAHAEPPPWLAEARSR